MQFETRAQLTQAPQQTIRAAFNYRGPSQALKSLQHPAPQRSTPSFPAVTRIV